MRVKTFQGIKEIEQFIDDFIFFRYRDNCPSWYSVLLARNCFTFDEKCSHTLNGKIYTPEAGKARIIELLHSGELAFHRTGTSLLPSECNHHIPWLESKNEEELLRAFPTHSLGPHDVPGAPSSPSPGERNKKRRASNNRRVFNH